jgi:cob(I)alamin adenosyltransferase
MAKVYTKTGDKGTTVLIGGNRVPKYHIRIEAYGTLDELLSYIGLIRDLDVEIDVKNALIEIQKKLMTCASIIATDTESEEYKIPKLTEDDVKFLEDEIDKMDEELLPLKKLILPGGHPIVSYCHIARNICRRAERNTTKVSEEIELPEVLLKFINRLSDYLFVLSRKLSQDLEVEEIPWEPVL